MLRLSRHNSTRLVRTLRDQGVIIPGSLSTAARSSLNCRRDLVTSAPHANEDRSRTRLFEANRRRVIRPGEGPSQLVWTPSASSATQWRGLAAGGGGKKDGGGSGKDAGMFDRLKKTFEEEVEKVCLMTPSGRLITAVRVEVEHRVVASTKQCRSLLLCDPTRCSCDVRLVKSESCIGS